MKPNNIKFLNHEDNFGYFYLKPNTALTHNFSKI